MSLLVALSVDFGPSKGLRLVAPLNEGQAARILDHARCRTIRTIKIRMTAPMNPAIK